MLASGGDTDLWFVGGYFGLNLNLFNLIPLWIFDGRAMFAPLDRWQAVIATSSIAAALFASAIIGHGVNPFALCVAGGAGWCTFRKFRGARQSILERASELGTAREPHSEATAVERVRATIGTTALAVLLILAVQLLAGRLVPPGGQTP
jgi:membrane-associated protease RseP (regulator of RpoE activity)